MRLLTTALVLLVTAAGFDNSARALSGDERTARKETQKAEELLRRELEELDKLKAIASKKGKAADVRAQKSVYAELEAAVKAGKLSKAEATEKLAALKKAGVTKNSKSAQAKAPKSVYAEIEAAVKAGKLSKEEAAEKLAVFKKAGGAKNGKSDRAKAQNSIYAELEAAVKAGKLSREEAREKLAALKRGGVTKNSKSTQAKAQKSVYAEIEAAVKAGRLSEEEAAEKMAALKKNPSQNGTNYEAISAKLRGLVKSGLITKGQAKAMLEAARKAAPHGK